jgi:hypothetical protein
MTNLVFDRGDGAHYHPDSVRTLLRRACEAAGVPVVTPHGLRHSGATIAVAQGSRCMPSCSGWDTRTLVSQRISTPMRVPRQITHASLLSCESPGAEEGVRGVGLAARACRLCRRARTLSAQHTVAKLPRTGQCPPTSCLAAVPLAPHFPHQSLLAIEPRQTHSSSSLGDRGTAAGAGGIARRMGSVRGSGRPVTSWIVRTSAHPATIRSASGNVSTRPLLRKQERQRPTPPTI